MSSTITIERAKLELALEALEGNTTNPVIDPEQAAIEDQAIAVLREALLAEQPAQQEPVAALYDDGTWIAKNTDAGRALTNRPFLFTGSPAIDVYITSPTPVPLTNTEFCEQWFKQTGRIMGTDKQLLLQAKRVTEAAHGITQGAA